MYCGGIKLNNIQEFNCDFDFAAEHKGLLTFYTSDLKNKLIIDFWEENSTKLIEVETYGEEWGNVSVG